MTTFDDPQSRSGAAADAVDRDTLRRWIANCDPQAPIDPSDERYFDLDRVNVGGEVLSLRGDDHIEGLYDGVTLSQGQSCQLFSGFSGTGKSTELRRLARLLENDGYSVLLVNAQDYHDLGHPLAIEDLLVIIAGAFGDATTERLGSDVLKDSYWQRLAELVKQDVQLGDVKLPLGIADLKIGIKHANSFWVKAREALAISPGQLRDHSHRFIQKCAAKITNAESPSRGVVFVLDSLERLTAPIPHFRDVMNSVLQVLLEYPEFLRLPDCHVIYTVPPYVHLINPALKARYDRSSLVLPAIKVLERGERFEPYSPGIDALAELVGRRLPLEQVFGNRRDLLDRLIVYSGGHVRTLIWFVRELVFRSRRRGLPPSEDDIERVVQPFREQARMAIWRETVPLLESILRKGTVESIREEDYAYLARFMDEFVVLCYRNGDGWYEIHPLIREFVQELADKIRAEDAKGKSDE
jgi:hypothetical protein